MPDSVKGIIATVVIAVLLAAVVVLIIVKLISDKKKGKHSCGGTCSGCSMSGSCHQEAKTKIPDCVTEEFRAVGSDVPDIPKGGKTDGKS